MLTAGDIDFMQESQDEIYTLRRRPLTFIYMDIEYDPVTGIKLGETIARAEALAVITNISIKSVGGERALVGGIEYEQGDIKIDIKIEAIETIADKVTRVEYGGKLYELLGKDLKGIGRRNRYEMLGREIA